MAFKGLPLRRGQEDNIRIDDKAVDELGSGGVDGESPERVPLGDRRILWAPYSLLHHIRPGNQSAGKGGGDAEEEGGGEEEGVRGGEGEEEGRHAGVAAGGRGRGVF
ncbi:hypothetical protein Syun_000296 [Stephania yunnanensis]|uniref:Uncharacterized protein n=1 Tax=Stephania yunnanensis TaxID=152371 RepID=A0AAP0LBV0_9MAGN